MLKKKIRPDYLQAQIDESFSETFRHWLGATKAGHCEVAASHLSHMKHYIGLGVSEDVVEEAGRRVEQEGSLTVQKAFNLSLSNLPVSHSASWHSPSNP